MVRRTLSDTGNVGSFGRASGEVVVQLIAELAATTITDRRVLTDVLTTVSVQPAFVVI